MGDLYPVFSNGQLALIHQLIHEEIEMLDALEGIKKLTKQDRDKRIMAQQICILLQELDEMNDTAE